ncbi:hypothetical protein NKDENANG_02892 [Candidatus Entotheonellaceae bacterium PAL068K]
MPDCQGNVLVPIQPLDMLTRRLGSMSMSFQWTIEYRVASFPRGAGDIATIRTVSCASTSDLKSWRLAAKAWTFTAISSLPPTWRKVRSWGTRKSLPAGTGASCRPHRRRRCRRLPPPCAPVLPVSPGESAAFVAEKIALGEIFQDGAAVHRNERGLRLAAVLVDTAGDKLLACACLADDQHVEIGTLPHAKLYRPQLASPGFCR